MTALEVGEASDLNVDALFEKGILLNVVSLVLESSSSPLRLKSPPIIVGRGDADRISFQKVSSRSGITFSAAFFREPSASVLS